MFLLQVAIVCLVVLLCMLIVEGLGGQGLRPLPMTVVSIALVAIVVVTWMTYRATKRVLEPVEWLLRMAPIPAGDFLDRIAPNAPLLDATADAVAAMHQAAAVKSAPCADRPASAAANIKTRTCVIFRAPRSWWIPSPQL